MLAAAVAVLCLVQQTSGDGYDPASDHVASRCASRCAFGWGFALPTLPRAQCAQLRMEGQPGASGAEAEMSRRRKKVLLRVRIKIMEDVVRRVNDPALSYHRKRETVDELEGYLHRMRALTADSGTDADADTLALTPPLERAVQPRTPAPDTQQQLREIEIAQVLARMRNAKVIAVLRGKNKQRCVFSIFLIYIGIVPFERCSPLLNTRTVLFSKHHSVAHSVGLTFVLIAIDLRYTC